MERDDFIDNLKGALFSNLSKPLDTNGKKFNWTMIHEFVYEEGLFGFHFKYDVNDVQRTCFLRPKKKQLEILTVRQRRQLLPNVL